MPRAPAVRETGAGRLLTPWHRARRVLGVVFACAGVFAVPAARADATCAQGGSLTVVTLNLLFYEVRDRAARLAIVADALGAAAQAGDPVDVVLLQEVVGGTLSGTDNAARDLAQAARARGVDYELDYSTYFNVGDPAVLSVSNAILSRCRILDSAHFPLPVAVEEILPRVRLPIRRTASLARLELPGTGAASVYNVHLCAYCTADDRLRQAQVMLDTLEFVHGLVPDPLVVLGGDMNTRVDVPAQRPLHDLVTAGHGFRDAYAEVNACEDCCSAAQGYAGCTFAVPGNPYARDIVSGQPEAPQRLDYVFVRPDAAVLQQALVAPTSGSWVSDHSAVFVRIAVPAPAPGRRLP